MAQSHGAHDRALAPSLQPWLELFVNTLQFEFTDSRNQPYLFSVGGDAERVQTSSQWCQTVKGAFARWSPNKKATPPKLLRSSFITYRARHPSQSPSRLMPILIETLYAQSEGPTRRQRC